MYTGGSRLCGSPAGQARCARRGHVGKISQQGAEGGQGATPGIAKLRPGSLPEKGRSKSCHGCMGQLGRPPGNKSADNTGAQPGWRFNCPGAGQGPDEGGGGLVTPPPANLDCKHGQPASVRPHELWVGPLFATARHGEGGAEYMSIALRRRLRLPLPLAPRRCGGLGQCHSSYSSGSPTLLCSSWGSGGPRINSSIVHFLGLESKCPGARGPLSAREPRCWRKQEVEKKNKKLAAAWIWSCMGPQSEARRCVAMPRWSARWIRRDALGRGSARWRRFVHGGQAEEGPLPGTRRPLAVEVGGRWHGDAVAIGRPAPAFARLRARRAPPALRQQARASWPRRWWSLLSVAAQRAVCSTVLGRLLPPLPTGAGGAAAR